MNVAETTTTAAITPPPLKNRDTGMRKRGRDLLVGRGVDDVDDTRENTCIQIYIYMYIIIKEKDLALETGTAVLDKINTVGTQGVHPRKQQPLEKEREKRPLPFHVFSFCTSMSSTTTTTTTIFLYPFSIR